MSKEVAPIGMIPVRVLGTREGADESGSIIVQIAGYSHPGNVLGHYKACIPIENLVGPFDMTELGPLSSSLGSTTKKLMDIQLVDYANMLKCPVCNRVDSVYINIHECVGFCSECKHMETIDGFMKEWEGEDAENDMVP